MLEDVGHDVALAVAQAGLQRVRVEVLRVPFVELAHVLGEVRLFKEYQLVHKLPLGLGNDKANQLLVRHVHSRRIGLFWCDARDDYLRIKPC